MPSGLSLLAATSHIEKQQRPCAEHHHDGNHQLFSNLISSKSASLTGTSISHIVAGTISDKDAFLWRVFTDVGIPYILVFR